MLSGSPSLLPQDTTVASGPTGQAGTPSPRALVSLVLPCRVTGAVPTSGEAPGCCSFFQTRKLAPLGKAAGAGLETRRALLSVPEGTVSLGKVTTATTFLGAPEGRLERRVLRQPILEGSTPGAER